MLSVSNGRRAKPQMKAGAPGAIVESWWLPVSNLVRDPETNTTRVATKENRRQRPRVAPEYEGHFASGLWREAMFEHRENSLRDSQSRPDGIRSLDDGFCEDSN